MHDVVLYVVLRMSRKYAKKKDYEKILTPIAFITGQWCYHFTLSEEAC